MEKPFLANHCCLDGMQEDVDDERLKAVQSILDQKIEVFEMIEVIVTSKGNGVFFIRIPAIEDDLNAVLKDRGKQSAFFYHRRLGAPSSRALFLTDPLFPTLKEVTKDVNKDVNKGSQSREDDRNEQEHQVAATKAIEKQRQREELLAKLAALELGD